MRLPPGLLPGPRWGAYSAPQTPSWRRLGHTCPPPLSRIPGSATVFVTLPELSLALFLPPPPYPAIPHRAEHLSTSPGTPRTFFLNAFLLASSFKFNQVSGQFEHLLAGVCSWGLHITVSCCLVPLSHITTLLVVISFILGPTPPT